MTKIILKILRRPYELAKKNKFTAFVMFSVLEWYNNLVSKKYNLKSALTADCLIFDEEKKEDICLITIAFNNEKLIELQILKMREFLSDNYKLFIADNSNNPIKAGRIKEVCQKYQTDYIKLPKNPWRQPNLSHGVALNWVYNNYVLKKNPPVFGFLDHDIFPDKKASIWQKFLDNTKMYGRVEKRFEDKKEFWYLWAGFCFFKTAYLIDRKVNFSSVVISNPNYFVELDSGGGNYKSIYSKTNSAEVSAARCGARDDGAEFLDEWIHIAHASFKDVAEINNFLNKIL